MLDPLTVQLMFGRCRGRVVYREQGRSMALMCVLGGHEDCIGSCIVRALAHLTHWRLIHRLDIIFTRKMIHVRALEGFMPGIATAMNLKTPEKTWIAMKKGVP